MSSFRKTLLLVLVLISVIILTFRYGSQIINSVFQVKEKAGIRVLSVPNGAKVLIDEKQVGTTPYEDQNFYSGEYDIKVMTDSASWQGKVELTPGTLTVINRELSTDSTSSAGEILTLEKGDGVTIISSPDGATIEIDGIEVGTTPLSVDTKVGEHTFALKRANYLNRSIRAYAPENYNLSLNVDLALSEADLTSISTPVITETPKVVVKETVSPNPGFLRVRDKPATTGTEIARALPGDELVLLEELSGWSRVRLADGTEGYVSQTYIEKKSL